MKIKHLQGICALQVLFTVIFEEYGGTIYLPLTREVAKP